MVKETNVNLNNYMGKPVTVKLNGNSRVAGILRGYDQMMNIVLEDAYEVIDEENKHQMGRVVSFWNSGFLIAR